MKKNNILNYLEEEEKEQFLDELLTLMVRFKIDINYESIINCIDYWEDIAELNSIPGFKRGVWERFNHLASRPSLAFKGGGVYGCGQYD